MVFLCTYTAECCVFSAFNLILLTLMKYKDNTRMIGMSDLKGLIATISYVDLELPLGIASEVVSNTLRDYFSQLSENVFISFQQFVSQITTAATMVYRECTV